jgi:hypothetical protein
VGKWSAFKTTLPAAPQDATHQQNVDRAKHELLKDCPNELGPLGRLYKDVRKEEEELEAKLKSVHLAKEALTQLVLKLFETQGMDQYRLDEGGSLSIKDEPYSAIGNRAEFLKWVKESGKEDLLSVNYQTMNSLVKEMLEAGQPAPPGIAVYIRTGLTYRKAR